MESASDTVPLAGPASPLASERAARPEKFTAILRAATQVFARSGFFNSKVADVARAAGVADGTVYLYFKSKDELLSSIFDVAMEEFIHTARRELTLLRDPREKLRRFAQLHFEMLEKDRDGAIVFQIELRHTTKFMELFSTTRLAEYLQIIREILEEGQHCGLFRRGFNPKLTAKILFGALDEMATNWVISHNHYPLTAMVDPVLDIFLGGVNTPENVINTEDAG
ncbi:MAG: TetR/AcrR family transcriptional regulator [Blastocatellia bacterium]